MWRLAVFIVVIAVIVWNDGVIVERVETERTPIIALPIAGFKEDKRVVEASPAETEPAEDQDKANPSHAGMVIKDEPAHQVTSLKRGDARLPSLEKQPRPVVRILQEELKRVGCYRFRVDNVWGRRSRDAMAKFNAAAKTNFDVAEPDADAVKVLKTYGNDICLTSCGQYGRNKTGEGCGVASPPKPAPVKVAGLKPVPPAAPFQDYDADDSYLPPWMRSSKKAARSKIAALNGAAQAGNDGLEAGTLGDEEELTTAKPAAPAKLHKPKTPKPGRTASKRPRNFSAKSFSFAWPGQY